MEKQVSGSRIGMKSSLQEQPDQLESIFTKALTSNRLITQDAVLRSDYLPDKLPFRGLQIASLGEILAPTLHYSKPSNVLIYGKTGTGKTAVTKYTMNKLKETSIANQIPLAFIYTNARLCGTEYRLLAEMATATNLQIPFTGLALTEVLSRLENHIRRQRSPIILVIDEVDYLVKTYNDDLLYNLTTLSERITPSFISIIGISNDLQFKDQLGARVQSRLSEEEIVFPPYTVPELASILKERATMALRQGSYTEAAINLCAALSASEHGDARRAVDLLRVGAETAEREASEILEEKHIRLALQKIDQDRVNEALKTLPLHAKLLLLGAATASHPTQNYVSTGALYETYSNLAKACDIEPLTTRRASSILTELHTLGLLSAHLVNYGRYGRTKQIRPQISLDTIKKAFSEDPIIGTITTNKTQSPQTPPN
jgi:cell division control protein 6